MERDINKLLIRSLTEDLLPEEASLLQAALSQSEELRLERALLLQTLTSVREAIPPANPAFVDRVMTNLDKKRKEVALVVQLFPRVAAACLAALVALTLFLYFEGGSLTAEALVGLEDLSVEEAVALTEY